MQSRAKFPKQSRLAARPGATRAATALICTALIGLFVAASSAAAAVPRGNSPKTVISGLAPTVLAAIGATDHRAALNLLLDGFSAAEAWLHATDTTHQTGSVESYVHPAAAHAQASEPPSAGRSHIPPASAGTNGTRFQHPVSVGSRTVVAHSLAALGPGAKGPTTTLVDGIALAPPSAPERIKAAINSANMISSTPYIWGGGHQSFYARGYDCSGAVSFALYGAGFLSTPLASVPLESWGAPGPGRWLTVYANAEHAYAVIAGLRWDTVGDAHGSGPRWHPNRASSAGFVARHFPGY